jgi:hypothetical protein
MFPAKLVTDAVITIEMPKLNIAAQGCIADCGHSLSTEDS